MNEYTRLARIQKAIMYLMEHKDHFLIVDEPYLERRFHENLQLPDYSIVKRSLTCLS